MDKKFRQVAQLLQSAQDSCDGKAEGDIDLDGNVVKRIIIKLRPKQTVEYKD